MTTATKSATTQAAAPMGRARKLAVRTLDWSRRAEAANASWEDRSACYNRPEAWWDADGVQPAAQARRVCLSCPVLAECLDATMRVEGSTMWNRSLVRGGLTGDQRVQLFLDQLRDGPYDAEEARLLALEAQAGGVPVTGVEESAEASGATVRLARRLAGERVEDQNRPTATELREGTARERAFREARQIVAWRQEGMSKKAIAARLGLGDRAINAVLEAIPVEPKTAERADAYLRGSRPGLTGAERAEAVAEGLRRGMTPVAIDSAVGLSRGATHQFISRFRRDAVNAGRPFPPEFKFQQMSQAQVVKIRERAAAGETDAEIGMSLGITRATISRIVTGQSHASAGGPIRPVRVRRSSKERMKVWVNAPNAKLSAEQRRMISQAKAGTEQQLAAEFGVSLGTIHQYAPVDLEATA